MDSNTAKRYAEALYSLAKDEDKIDSCYTGLVNLERIFTDNPDLGKIFSHVKISLTEKMELMEKCCENEDDLFKKFAGVLTENSRTDCLEGIVKEYRELMNFDRNIISGIVYSPYELTKEEIEKIEKALSKKEGKEVSLDLKIDKTLISGIKVDLQGKIIDGSMKNNIENLRNALKEVN